MNLPDHARVWIYGAERPLTETEAQAAKEQAADFAQRWVAHNRQLKADANLLHNRFLVLAVDESMAGASGCSIDSSVHFVQQLGAQLGIDFFNRMQFSYRTDAGNIETLDRKSFKAQYALGAIHDATTVFDPMVNTLGDLRASFEKPLAASWHKRMV